MMKYDLHLQRYQSLVLAFLTKPITFAPGMSSGNKQVQGFHIGR